MKNPGLRGLAAAVLGATLASATPGQAVPIRYDCDTAEAVFSMIDLTQPGPDYRISGRLSALQFRSHSGWFPVANVRLISANKKNLIGIRLQREARSGPIEFLLQTFEDGQERTRTVTSLSRGEAAPFAIEVTGGQASVRFGERTIPVNVGVGMGASVQITCSTGQFLFEELDWDTPIAR